jgi:acyl-CoA thioesterase
MSDQELAQACAETMFARDRASQSAGMRIDAVEPGYAKLSMELTGEMINGHRTAHGGAIFMLADSAFAFACNSRNVATVAQHCSISFVTPGREGERLNVECRETNLSGRFGIYDATVTGQDGRVVAIFRGYSAAVRGAVLETDDA